MGASSDLGASIERAKRLPPAAASPATRLAELAGVGPKTAERLRARGLVTVADALLFLPRRYADRRAFTPIAAVKPGVQAVIAGRVVSTRVRFAGRRAFEVAVEEEGPNPRIATCRWFRFSKAALEARFPRGQRVIVSGLASTWGATWSLVHPDSELLDADEDAAPAGLVPEYPEVDGVPAKTLRKLLLELAPAALQLEDPLPADLRARRGLPELGPAVLAAHRPEREAPPPLRRRLVFDVFFHLQLALAARRREVEAEEGFAHAAPPWPELARGMFDFPLTDAQRRTLDEIAADLARPHPMNRLLQGDVGSGKTAVALVAARIVIAAGRQVALMAPTEILAEQHHANVRGHVRSALLTGSTRAKARRGLLDALRVGELDLLVGTHALLEPDVCFRELGLVIVDEQHRFGVEQRAALRAKSAGPRPDVLVMTATPIPRTLALTLYGDLRVSVLDELPPGRTPPLTRVFDGTRDRAEVYAAVERALDEGRQAFVVYPLVEASAKIDLAAATEAVETLRARFAPRPVGLLHGRMRGEEKNATMARFARGELSVLVTTTVVEVGVDVPNATVMVVEHADRFGLSQLHQLRGRVGRGLHRGVCCLVAADPGAEGLARLAVLESTTDGFAVAERDLETRGPGDFAGTRQAGLPDLGLADLVRDARILEEAREDAFALAEAGIPEPLRAEMIRRFGPHLALATVG